MAGLGPAELAELASFAVRPVGIGFALLALNW